MTEPRWLDDDEMRAWRAFIKTTVRLFEQLDESTVEVHFQERLGDLAALHARASARSHNR